MTPQKIMMMLRVIAAHGLTGDALLARMERNRQAISSDAARAGLGRALELVGGEPLRPTARAALLGRSLSPPAGRREPGGQPGLVLTAALLPELTETAVDLLRSYAATLSPDATAPVSPERRSAALQLAEAVVRQDEALADFRMAREDPASLHARISESDRERLEAGLLYLRYLRVDPQIACWRDRVDWMARGSERYDIDTHLDSLDRRDALQRLFQALSPTGLELLHAALDPIDADFLACTRELPVPIGSGLRAQPPAWWRYRVPRTIGPNFKRSLDARLAR